MLLLPRVGGDIVIIYIELDTPTAWGKNNKQISKTRDGRPFLRKSNSVKATEEKISLLIAGRRPKKPMDGALKLHVMACFPYKATESKSVVKAGNLLPKTTAPDVDGVLTTIMDVLEKSGFVANDSRFYCVHAEKWYGPHGFIRIEITKNEDKNENE